VGNVVIDQGPRRMSGATATFSLDSKTGTLTQASAQVAPDYYFSGTEVAKVGDNTYTVTNGVFTSCNQKVPDWSFKLGKARVEVEGYAHVSSAALRAKKLPVFYTPYILWPVKSERSSGFLIPNIGYSDRRGAQLGLAYFQTLGRSYDTTLHVDLYAKNFLGLGDELRYRPSDGTRGDFIGYLVRDSEKQIAGDLEKDLWRWKMEWNHVTNDLPYGMRGVVHYLNFSDFNFFRDFERDFDRSTLRTIDSRASVTGNWGPNLLNLLLNDRETFINQDDSVLQRKLPEIEYRLRSTRLGRTPLYMQFEGSASFLDLARPDSYEGRYGRFDLFPQLTLPIRSFPWLSLSVTGGERLTFYGDSLTANASAFSGDTLTRTLPYGNAEILGPSVSRIFDWEIGKYGKFKHVIEPRFTYTYQGTFDDQPLIPQFDEVDTQISSNSGRVALDNRVLAKPKDGKGSAREVFLFEISRSYSFDDKQPLLGTPEGVNSLAGPFEALMRFNPGENVTLKLEASYDTLFKGLASTGLSGNYGSQRGNFVGATWFTRYAPDTGDTVGDQIRLNGGINLLPRRLRLEGQINYDLEQSLLQQQRYILTWTSQCYGLRLELRDFRTGPATQRVSDKELRFALSLKNVGTFLDLTSRSSTTIEP
jgi:LPS-assembly protein